jgi:hypothetical protein
MRVGFSSCWNLVAFRVLLLQLTVLGTLDHFSTGHRLTTISWKKYRLRSKGRSCKFVTLSNLGTRPDTLQSRCKTAFIVPMHLPCLIAYPLVDRLTSASTSLLHRLWRGLAGAGPDNARLQVLVCPG